ncbi:MAG: hypothetical protein AAGJ87_04315 [Pseudomonadota bacterium]
MEALQSWIGYGLMALGGLVHIHRLANDPDAWLFYRLSSPKLWFLGIALFFAGFIVTTG